LPKINAERKIVKKDQRSYDHRVEVVFSPAQYDLYQEDMDIVVVIDVLRATSAMVTAFENGAKAIIPVATVDEAKAYLGKEGFIAAAERNGEVVEGFPIGNSPYDFMGDHVKGKTVVISTTNGTRAITMAKDKPHLVIGSMLNLDAICEWLIEQEKNVLLFCSGWQNKFNLEDTTCAGAIISQLLESGKFGLEEDTSIAAKFLFMAARANFTSMLKSAPRRKRLEQLDLLKDAKYCLTLNQSRIIPVLKNGELVKMESVVTPSTLN